MTRRGGEFRIRLAIRLRDAYLDTEQDGLGSGVRRIPGSRGRGDQGTNAGIIAAPAREQDEAAAAGAEGDGGEKASHPSEGGRGEGFGTGARGRKW